MRTKKIYSLEKLKPPPNLLQKYFFYQMMLRLAFFLLPFFNTLCDLNFTYEGIF